MKEVRYVLDMRSVLHGVNEGCKEIAPMNYSERLTITYRIINTSLETTLRVIKTFECGVISIILSRLY